MVVFWSTGAPVLSLLALLLAAQQPQLAQAAATNATVTAPADGLVGWFNCSAITFKDQKSTADSFLEYGGFNPSVYGGSNYDKEAVALDQAAKEAQCAQYQAPLCHAGICDNAQNRTIDVFVKRVLAISSPETRPNVWFFQGGPGYASPTMEYGMRALYVELKGLVNVYTMDHRGTGRSNPLDCVGAQATTSGSPMGADIDVTEFAKCAQELQAKYGDMAAFSVTSAATDISTFISTYQSGSKTFVYGVSYGSALVERLIHLDTKEIVGYILDGVSTTSGGDIKDGMYMSNWDVNFDQVSSHYFDLLNTTTAPKVAKAFGSKSVASVLQSVLKDLDTEPKSKCAKWLTSYFSANTTSTTASATPASYYVRQLLGKLFTIASVRSTIPVVVHRLNRCSNDDRLVLANFFAFITERLTKPSEEGVLVSALEYYLIVFSEMWESPTPDMATMLARFTNAKVSSGPIGALLPLYCAFTKDTSAACTALASATSLGSSPALAYKKDKYWNVAAKIPAQASVLILSGKLDPQTPHKYAERLLAALDGDNKELVTFEYTPHGALFSAQIRARSSSPYFDVSTPKYCAVEIIASYVTGAGDLAKLAKLCVSETDSSMADLGVDARSESLFFGTNGDMFNDDLLFYYSTTLKTPLIIVSVVGGILALCMASYLCKKLKARRAQSVKEAAAQAVVQGSPTNETNFVSADSRV